MDAADITAYWLIYVRFGHKQTMEKRTIVLLAFSLPITIDARRM
jgi:hypothetical protein